MTPEQVLITCALYCGSFLIVIGCLLITYMICSMFMSFEGGE